MPEPHPTDRSLAAFVDSRLDEQGTANVRAHVEACPRCQIRIANADPTAGPLTPVRTQPPVAAMIEERDEPPVQGDVWRLAWDDLVLLVVVWRLEADRVAVLPILDIANADDWCVLIDRTASGGLGDLAVSVPQETVVNWAVLDARVSHLDDLNHIGLLRAAYRRGTDPGEAPRGAAVLSALDDRLVELDELAETLATFANAKWASDEVDASTVQLTYDVLIDAGLAPNRALAIGVRSGAPTDDEADRIEAATGHRPAPPPIPLDLQRAIDKPRRKPLIRARARATHRSEATERLALARAAEPSLQAARGTGGAPPDYDVILDRLLDA